MLLLSSSFYGQHEPKDASKGFFDYFKQIPMEEYFKIDEPAKDYQVQLDALLALEKEGKIEEAEKLLLFLLSNYGDLDLMVEAGKFYARQRRFADSDKFFRKSISGDALRYNDVQLYYFEFGMYDQLIQLLKDARLKASRQYTLFIDRDIISILDTTKKFKEAIDFILDLLSRTDLDNDFYYISILEYYINDDVLRSYIKPKLMSLIENLKKSAKPDPNRLKSLGYLYENLLLGENDFVSLKLLYDKLFSDGAPAFNEAYNAVENLSKSKNPELFLPFADRILSLWKKELEVATKDLNKIMLTYHIGLINTLKLKFSTAVKDKKLVEKVLEDINSLGIDSGNLNFWDSINQILGEFYFKEKDIGKALFYLRKIYSQMREDVQDMLIQCYWHLGDFAAAEKMISTFSKNESYFFLDFHNSFFTYLTIPSAPEMHLNLNSKIESYLNKFPYSPYMTESLYSLNSSKDMKQNSTADIIGFELLYKINTTDWYFNQSKTQQLNKLADSKTDSDKKSNVLTFTKIEPDSDQPTSANEKPQKMLSYLKSTGIMNFPNAEKRFEYQIIRVLEQQLQYKNYVLVEKLYAEIDELYESEFPESPITIPMGWSNFSKQKLMHLSILYASSTGKKQVVINDLVKVLLRQFPNEYFTYEARAYLK